MGKPAAIDKQNCPGRTSPREGECEEEILVGSSKDQNNNPAACATGLPVVCWDWLKARRPLRTPTSLGLKDSRLKPQPPHVCHYNQNFSFFGSPSFPVYFDSRASLL